MLHTIGLPSPKDSVVWWVHAILKWGLNTSVFRNRFSKQGLFAIIYLERRNCLCAKLLFRFRILCFLPSTKKNNSALYSQWPKYDQRVHELANFMIKNTLKCMWTGCSKPVVLSTPTAFQKQVCKAVSRRLSLWPNFLFYLTPSSSLWKTAGCYVLLKGRLSVLTIPEAKLHLKGVSTTAKHFIRVDRCNSKVILKN